MHVSAAVTVTVNMQWNNLPVASSLTGQFVVLRGGLVFEIVIVGLECNGRSSDGQCLALCVTSYGVSALTTLSMVNNDDMCF